MRSFSVHGSIVALITPFHEDHSIDWDALKRLVDWHIEQGTDAIVSVGTTGESATLDNAEHIQVMQKTIEFARDRIPIIAGTGANSTAEALYLTKEAAEIGAHACLLVTPYYNRPSQRGLYAHFKKIAESVPIPQILYNVPKRTGCDLEDDTTIQLAAVDNIVGLKDATGSMRRIKYLKEHLGEDFLLYSGDDPSAREFIHHGGHGCVSVAANIIPQKFKLLCDTAASKPLEAMALQTLLDDLFAALALEPNPVPIKWACAWAKLCGMSLRLPLVQLEERFHQPLQLALEKAEVCARP